MSLLDAILLEPPAPSGEYWFALRADGVAGSGRQDDPWDASTKQGPMLSATLACERTEVLVTTKTGHGLAVGQPVTIGGVTGILARVFNKEFPVDSVVPGEPSTQFKFKLTPPLPPQPLFEWEANHATVTRPGQPVLTDCVLDWLVVTGTTAENHGYFDNEVVAIAGAVDPAYNGTFTIFGAAGNTFKYRLAKIPEALPSGGSPTCSKIIYRLDDRLRSLSSLTHLAIHLGPGTFETRGNGAYLANQGWLMRKGWKLVGSGIDVTVLKMASGTRAPGGGLYSVVGGTVPWYGPAGYPAEYADYSEISDLTADCNLHGNRNTAVGAVALSGSHTRIRRVRAINWGTEAVPECFVIFSGFYHPSGGEVVDCLAEDCIVEKPSENNTHESGCIGMIGAQGLGKPDPLSSPAFHRGCVIRHCFVDTAYANGFSRHPIAVQELRRHHSDVTLALLTTTEPHQHIREKALVVRGATPEVFNGVFAIEEIASPTQLTYRLFADPGSTNPATGQITIGNPLSSEYILIDTITVETGVQYKLKTTTPHYRTANHRVRLAGVKLAPGSIIDSLTFNGSFKVDQVLNAYELLFTLGVPEPDTETPTGGVIGVEFHGVGVEGGREAVAEGNHVMNCRLPYYHDVGTTRSSIVRNNHFQNVYVGAHLNFGGWGELQSVTDIDWYGGLSVTVKTAAAHGLSRGDAVLIVGVRVGGSIENDFNGFFSVSSVGPADDIFNCALKAVPTAEPDPGQSAIAFRVLYQVGHFVFENNVVELAPTFSTSPAIGVGLGDAGTVMQPPPYIFRQVVIRNNVIRMFNDVTDPNAHGLVIQGCGNLLTEGNIIDAAHIGYPMTHTRCEFVNFSNNRSPSGLVLTSLNLETGRYEAELADVIEEATLFALL
jgi:hypothetical protein